MTSSRYIHTEVVHNMDTPQEVVPVLMELFQPSSVVDMGCGLGTFTASFQAHRVSHVLGVDGPWVDANLRRKNLSDDHFLCSKLDEYLDLGMRYDLAISLEVAEHLDAASADIFVHNLTEASDTIVFSAAIPHQGGQNHINEQWLSYWKSKFENKGYAFYDVLRYRFWNNPSVFHWYRQNMVVFSKKDLSHLASNVPVDIVHPDFYLDKAVRLENIMAATHVPKYYMKLLFQSIRLSLSGNRKAMQRTLYPKDE